MNERTNDRYRIIFPIIGESCILFSLLLFHFHLDGKNKQTSSKLLALFVIPRHSFFSPPPSTHSPSHLMTLESREASGRRWQVAWLGWALVHIRRNSISYRRVDVDDNTLMTHQEGNWQSAFAFNYFFLIIIDGRRSFSFSSPSPSIAPMTGGTRWLSFVDFPKHGSLLYSLLSPSLPHSRSYKDRKEMREATRRSETRDRKEPNQ